VRRNTSIRFLGLIFIISLCFGCKPKKEVVAKYATVVDAPAVLQMIENQNLDYEYLEASGTAIVNSPQMNVSGNFLLRLHKDNTAWMRVQKFGFEAVRLLIQDDSLCLLNRLDKSYQKMSLVDAAKMTNLRLNQSQIVDLMAGCAITEDASFISMKEDSLGYAYKLGFDDFYATHTLNLTREMVVESEFIDLEQRSLVTEYSKFDYIDSLQMGSFERRFQYCRFDGGP